jgi:cyclohexyl-isocyanide hydratase
MMTPLNIGLVMYPDMTQLDLTAPHQVFASLPQAKVYLLWKTLEPVVSNGGLTILPNTIFGDCPPLDVLCVPGGVMGTVQMMQDPEMLTFLRNQAATAKYITSVCTGSLILGAAGLLQGYRAATHWAFRDILTTYGATVSTERVEIDRNRITGGGVTAGIDFALTIVGLICDENTAQFLELMLEYNPQPPFKTGSPELAGEELMQQVQVVGKELIAAAAAAAAARNSIGVMQTVR